MFYTFSQNNSGGRFHPPAIFVIVEASSPYEANHRAEHEVGLYWDGVHAGRDCPCCGDRWDKLFDDDHGTESPTDENGNIFWYDEPYTGNFRKIMAKNDKVPFAMVYYLDGTTSAIS